MKYSAEVVQKGLDILENQGLTPVHRLVLELVPEGSRVLEVGCAAGHLSRALRERRCRVTGVELVPDLAARAHEHTDHLFQGSIEDPACLAALPTDHDVVVLADVLEHLADPWATVERLKTTATAEALWLLTVPNVAHWRMRLRLLRGRWEYTDFGLLDRTHLRFFTLHSFRVFLAEVGLTEEACHVTELDYPWRGRLRRIGLAARLEIWMEARYANLLGAHFLFEAQTILR
jgi:SAM-dependent methyltransferase